MNNYSRYDVMRISEHLHLCMVKAIDTALTARSGADWFEKFKEIDSKSEKTILENHYTSVHSMDLQSCFKFFKFGEDYAKIVFEYYGNNFYLQNQDAQKAEKQLKYLLNNLMNNVRNEVYAHASANMIENGASSVRYSVYGYNEAINDMIKFASFFKQVTDNDGVSYYEKMLSMTRVKNTYSIANTIKQEKLKTDIGTFVTACNNLGIGILTGNNGELLFVSSNYAGDLAQIILSLNREQSKKGKTVLIVVIAIVIAIAGAVALVIGLSGNNKSENPQGDTQQTQEQVTSAKIETTEPVATQAEVTEQVTTQEVTQPATEAQVTSMHMYGEAEYNGLDLKIDQEQSDDIILYYENNSKNPFHIGWGGMISNFVVETESGKFKSDQFPDHTLMGSGMLTINPGDSGTIELNYENLDEPIVSFSFDNILTGNSPVPGEVIIPIEYK